MIRAEKNGSATGRIGMWLFIATEILLFGGLFLLYSMYRAINPAAFHAGSMELDRFMGTLNTVILITSSFTAALSVDALRRGNRGRSALMVCATIAMAVGFLAVKTVEWTAKYHHGLMPGQPHLLSLAHGEILYFGLYFMMTGLHAVHVIVGIGVLSFVLSLIRRKRLSAQNCGWLDNAVLYWHLVDVIWIFLFPLFYLIT